MFTLYAVMYIICNICMTHYPCSNLNNNYFFLGFFWGTYIAPFAFVVAKKILVCNVLASHLMRLTGVYFIS